MSDPRISTFSAFPAAGAVDFVATGDASRPWKTVAGTRIAAAVTAATTPSSVHRPAPRRRRRAASSRRLRCRVGEAGG
ncbi:hypothetical protein HUX53_15855 [Actinomadura sp. BRA 177]|nr:hypothetical protein [Actinomadura sp. BRA 177]